MKTYGRDLVEAYCLKPEEKGTWMENKQAYENKSTRGFNDNIFGRLLCPHKYSAEFEADPDGYAVTLAPVIVY